MNVRGHGQSDLFHQLAEHCADPPSQTPLCARLAALFKSKPGVWIDGRQLATVAGTYGWRTRVSDLRRPPFNFTIENRQRRKGRQVVSEYRLVESTKNLHQRSS